MHSIRKPEHRPPQGERQSQKLMKEAFIIALRNPIDSFTDSLKTPPNP